MHTVEKSLLSLPPLRFDESNREDLRAYFLNTWELYERLMRSIQDESHFYEAPDPLRHPLIFYLGHTAVFYINKLKLSGALTRGINERFEVLLAVGVDPERSDDLETEVDWPSVASVWAYREAAHQVILDVIDREELIANPKQDTPQWALHMGLEHERIHFETSSVLIRQYPADYLQRPEGWEYAPTGVDLPSPEWCRFQGGSIALGKPSDMPTYGWDNEYGRKSVEVAPFELANLMVTNEEFRAFVDAGGYQNETYWSEEGWQWVQKNNRSAPPFWRPAGNGFRYRAVFDELDLPLDWPVEVCFHEATAYCKWRGENYRLMSEAEWKWATQNAPEARGDAMFADCHNLNLAYGSPSPVGMMGQGCTQEGVYDLYGNVWDWVSDDFYPLPGFAVHPWYEDFSAPFMDADHSMLLGGAWASSGTSASKYYRLWFRRGFLQHAGFRLARSL